MHQELWTIVLAACLAAGCEPAGLPAAEGNNVCDEPSLAAVLPNEIRETSGIATSLTHDGIFWTHNDSGHEAVVYAIDSTGTVRARVRVDAATNRDWEDIELAPCEPGDERHCLFIGEIGDNGEQHGNVAVYRIPEPDPATDTVSEPARIFRFTYPDGPRDAESLFVTTAGIHVITKGRSGPIELYRLPPPYRPVVTVPIDRVQQLAPPPTSHSAQVTGAAADSTGRRVAVRSYSGLHFFEVHGDTLRVHGRHADGVAPDQAQGESVDFTRDGRFILTSEARGNAPARLDIVRCDPSRPPADSTGEG